MQTRLGHLVRSTPRSTRARRRGLVALVAVAAVLVGCSSGGLDSSGSTTDAPSEAGGQAAAPQQDGATSGQSFEAQSSGSQGSDAAQTLVDLDVDVLTGRDVIRTAAMTIIAEDLADARAEVSALMDRVGGVIASESTTTGGRLGAAPAERTIRLGLQVPTSRFDATVEELRGLGRKPEVSIQTEDVTAQVADIDSRVDSARAALERIRALLTRANSLGTVIRLEGVLSDRQADLEALVAQQRALAGQTQLATISLEMRTPQPDDTPPATEEEELSGFVDGLREGWDAMRTFVVAVGTTVGVLLPFAALLALLALPVLVWRRRRPGPLDSRPLTPPAT